jgi:hypothetical protein
VISSYRLSLANDSDELIERLICTLPKSPDQPWFSFDDAYGASAWDIYPSCQIAGIADQDTVIIDGARAASVHWEGFSPVFSLRRSTWKRLIAQFMVHNVTAVALIAFIFLGANQVVIGAILLVYALVVAFLAPWLLRIMYCGKFWGTQPWFFGFESYLDIDTIEYQIFGARMGRLSWSAYGSPLSRHHKDEFGECVGDDPMTDPHTRDLVERCKHVRPGEQRVSVFILLCCAFLSLYNSIRCRSKSLQPD